jgi:hypothetical protein
MSESLLFEVRKIEVNSSARDTDKERMRRLEIFWKVRRSWSATQGLTSSVTMFARGGLVFSGVNDHIVTEE